MVIRSEAKMRREVSMRDIELVRRSVGGLFGGEDIGMMEGRRGG